MGMQTKFRILSSLLATIALFGWWHIASATTLSPIRIELAVDPGSTISSNFTVRNDGEQTTTYYIQFARFETKDETGEPAFVPGDLSEIPSWVTAPSQIEVPGKSGRNVDFSITVPANVDPGGYFAAAFIGTTPPQLDEQGNNIGVISDVGTLIFLRVNGQFVQGETVLDFDTKNRKHFFTSVPVEFYYRFQNNGEDRIKPLGDIIINNIFGRTTKILNANRTTGSVLPRSIRRFEAGWYRTGGNKVQNLNAEPEFPKNNSFFEQLKFQWSHFTFGKFQANMQVTVNNDSSRSYSKHISFWVVPWQLLVVVGGIAFIILIPSIILFIILIVYLRRRR